MKKRLIAVVLVLMGTLMPAAAGESQAQAAAEQLYCLGLLNGAGTNPDGTPDFNLGGTMTRGEAIIMVVRLSGYEGQALSREEILDTVWGRDYFGELKIVDVNIRRLRIKIEDNPQKPVYITTVWGYGYKWGF